MGNHLVSANRSDAKRWHVKIIRQNLKSITSAIPGEVTSAVLATVGTISPMGAGGKLRNNCTEVTLIDAESADEVMVQVT